MQDNCVSLFLSGSQSKRTLVDELDIGSVITTPSTSFVVKDFLGQGSFGKVALCTNTMTHNNVALKIIKYEEYITDAKHETKILEKLKAHGSEEHNIVRWISSFEFRHTYCLEFEKLDISLSHFIAKIKLMSLSQIRPVLHQIATAMMFIKNLDIIHGDLKPENIMMVDHASSLKVKMIDFGTAHSAKLVEPGLITQTAYYRAPEVFVGAKYNEAIDVWSLGCIALEMLMGKLLFDGDDDNAIVRNIVKTLGTPPMPVLRRGMFSDRYFHHRTIRGTTMRNIESQSNRFCVKQRMINSIAVLCHMDRMYFESSSVDMKLDWQYFLDLVSKQLCLDPEERITPEEILEHPFTSMRRSVNVFDTEHVRQSVEMMEWVPSCPREQQAVDNKQPSISSSNERPSSKRSRDGDNEKKGTNPDRSSQKPTKRKYVTKKRMKTVRFVTDSSSSRRSPPSVSRKPREFTEEQALHRPNLVVKRRKWTPFPKVVPLVSDDDQDSSSSSDSRKWSEEDEEKDEDTGLSCVLLSCVLLLLLILLRVYPGLSHNRQESGSRKRDREEEEGSRPNLPVKRRKGPPISKVVYLVSEDNQASSSSGSGSRKRSREDEEKDEDTGLRRSPKILRAESSLVPRFILVRVDQFPSQDRQESGSRKRDREEEENEEKEEDDGPSMALKRRRSTARPD